MVKESIISGWVAFLGTPEIMMVCKDSRFIRKIFREFRTSHNIILQTVIPGHHQSLGATERRHRLFRTSIDHVIGGRKPKNLRNKEWEEFDAMATMRLNSQVQQYGGFTPWERVFGRAPKLPIGAVGNPFFEDFMNSSDAPTTKTHNLISALFKIRQEPISADFQSKVDTALFRMVRNAKAEECFFSGNGFFIASNRKKNNVDKKRVGAGIIIGRFWNKYALVHFRWSYFEVGLGDMRPANSLFGVIGCGGTLTLHIPHTKFPIHYLVGSQTLVFLT